MIIKSILSPLHKIRGFWIDVWMKTHPWINIRQEIKCMNSLCDPKVPYIILAQSRRLWMGVWLKTCMNSLCSPRVYSIIFTQNPRVLDRCVNEDSSLGSMNVYYNKQSNETIQFNLRVYLINSMWNPKVSWVWEFNSISFIVDPINPK
jgi:hypothetical protein